MQIELTIPQKNMYNTQNFFDNTSINNLGGCIFLGKNIHVSTLKRAINELIKNSDGLRIRLDTSTVIPTQRIVEYVLEDITELKLKDEEYRKILEEDMKKPFNITEKLYSFKVLDVNGLIGVYIKIHHVISDAWSMALIGKKITDYYNLLVNNREINENILSYLDFIESDRQYIESEQFNKDKEYWQAKFDTEPTYVTMSPNKKVDMNIEANRSSFKLTNEETTKLYAFCNETGISIAVLFESLIGVYSAKINNSNDVTLCSMVINRNGFAEKNTIGMYNNILPLTVQVDLHESFISLCQKISTEHYQMFRHQKYPLENILEYVRKKYAKDTMLYDIMVSYQNAKINTQTDISTNWIFNGTSDLGFMLNISDMESKNEMEINIDWRKNCFTEGEIQEIYARLKYMITQILTNKELNIEEIEILTNKEKQQILVEFNNTEKEYPKDRCLHWYLEENAIKNPEKVALRFEGTEITYKEFNERANQLAHFIQENVKDKNIIIGIMCERSFEMMISIYATLKAGHSYMPIDPHFPVERIEFMVEDSNTPIILTQTKWKENINVKASVVDVENFEYSKYSCENLEGISKSTDVAYVIYTSGSTGKPKGAMIEHHSAVNRIKWMHEKYPLLDKDIILQKTPYTFDVSVWELFWWSMYNGTLQILVPEGHKDPRELVKAICEGNVTHIHFVPSMLNMFLEYLKVNQGAVKQIATLKYVFASGEALQVEQVKLFYKLLEKNGTTLHNLYGPTECAVDVSYYDCDKNNIPNSIPIGKPIDNTQLFVLGKNHELLPVGVVGELYISGVQVGRGYINREELTKEKFVPNLYYNYPTMYKTGDLAMWLPDGNIEYCGRTDFQIKIRGLRVELGDIENAMLKYENINQVLVVAVDLKGEKELCAYYTANVEIDIDELKKNLLETLPEYMIPTYFMQIKEMPVNENGKANRKLLPLPEIKQKNEEFVEPKTLTEQVVYKYVCDILEIEQISCTSDLFEYGLSSLGVISMLVKLSGDGYEIKVKDVYETRTIQNIAKLLENTKTVDLSNENYEEDEKYYSDVSDVSNHHVETKEASAILITGATSFLGIHIIQEIYSNTNKTIYCLIRNEEKFKRFVENYTNISYPNSRLILVKGDITKENLGLDEVSIGKIKNEISDVIHCAADVSFFCQWEKSKSINYTGTCNVLKVAKDAKAKLHHISTMSVSGDILTKQTKEYPEFTENDLYIGQKYKENVYAHSKYLAEKEIIKAIREDRINASIYRIANLTWRVSDGKFQEKPNINDLYILTKIMVKHQKIPKELMNENISLTPVDDAAKAITTLMDIKENQIFNLYSKNSMSIKEYIDYLIKAKPVEIKDFYNTIKEDKDPESQFVQMYIAGIIDDGKNGVVKINNSITNEKLEKLGYIWSNLKKEYIIRYKDIK